MADVRTSRLGSLDLRLASWVPLKQRYQRRLISVDPESEVEAGDVPGLNAQPEFRTFRARSWQGGEGVTWWERGLAAYRESTNVRPTRQRDGLELGARQIVTPPSGGSGTFNDGSRFGYGLGQLWAGDDGSGYPWDVSNEYWGSGVTSGAGTSDFTSMTDGDDTFMYSGHESGEIRRWKSGSNTDHYASGTFTNPVVRSYAGRLFALDGDDLYEIDKTTPDTRTQKSDLDGSSAVYLAETPWCYGRMSLSDKGPIWVRRLDNGQTLLEHYNPHLDFQETLGKLPVDFAFPYSVFFTAGFAFVAYRYAPTHSEAGDAYLWFKKGATDGTVGPFRVPSGVTASKPILIAGVIGSEIMIYFDGAIWAYDVDAGGLFQVAEQTTSGTPQDAVTFGKDVFIGPVTSGGNTNAVERFDTTAYTTETATIDLGKHDFDYPGIGKILLDVTVVTDPLPANTSIQAAVSVDGGSFSNIGSASSTTGQTKHKWTVSSNSSTVSGVEFELRLLLGSSSTSATPTVREVSARATGADHVLEVLMEVDVSQDIGRTKRQSLISSLNSLATAGDIVSWTDRFQSESKDSDVSIDVRVVDVVTPQAQTGEDEEASATVRLHAVALQND